MLFYAVPQYQWPPEAIEGEAKQVLAYAATSSNLAGVAVEQQFTVSNSPCEAIIEAAKAFRCELIVMSHGRRGISGALLGSETQKVLAHSRIPVLVVR